MMSKKKKDKSDEPKKTKTKSSKKASPDPTGEAGVSVSAGGATARPKPRRTAAARKKVAFEISAAEIALRAYYIAEHRRNLDLPGDELGDWVEAERQLRKESARKSA